MSSLYIHVPFCQRKCRYCDFISFDSARDRIEDYFKALLSEIKTASARYPIKGVSTVFFGGGTPSFVDEKYIANTLDAVRKNIGIAEGAEITIEANPNSLSKTKLKAYRRAGVNRLSIGLQSTDNALLAAIGRLHTKETFERAFHLARDAGFSNINVDLIYALPGQTVEQFRQTLLIAARLSPEHVSAYSLTLASDTPLYEDIKSGRLCAAGEEEDRKMYHEAVEFLRSQGYKRYEISNFSKKGYECAHNLAYWERKDYLGIGTAAHSCIGAERFSNMDDLNGYISCLLAGELAYNNRESLDERQIETEHIMLGLRLAGGLDLAAYKKLFGRDFEAFFARPIDILKKAGLAEVSGGRFYATDKGFDLQNTLVLELIENL